MGMDKIQNDSMTPDTDLDFKYVLQDFSNVFLGARLTIKELSQNEDTPQKLCSAVSFYMYGKQEEIADERICDLLVSMDEKSAVYRIFSQLKAMIRISEPVLIHDKKGNEKSEFRMKEMNIEEFMNEIQQGKEFSSNQVTEIWFKKRFLLTLGIS